MLGLDEGQSMSLVYLVALLALIIVFRFFGLRGPRSHTYGSRPGRGTQDPPRQRASRLQQLLLWAAIALALAVAYAYRDIFLGSAAPVP